MVEVGKKAADRTVHNSPLAFKEKMSIASSKRWEQNVVCALLNFPNFLHRVCTTFANDTKELTTRNVILKEGRLRGQEL